MHNLVTLVSISMTFITRLHKLSTDWEVFIAAIIVLDLSYGYENIPRNYFVRLSLLFCHNCSIRTYNLSRLHAMPSAAL